MLFAFLAAVLATAALAACGEDDSTTQSSSPPAGEERPSGSTDGKTGSTGSSKPKGGGDSTGSKDSGGPKPEEVSTPLRVSGGGSEQFRVKGGDNSIQEFGEESDEAELEQAATTVHDFYLARAEERWSEACSHLASELIEQLEQLAQGSDKLRDKGCPAVLEAFTNPLPLRERRETTLVDAASLRQEGDQAFFIYRGEGDGAFAILMMREDDSWKVGALAGSPLS